MRETYLSTAVCAAVKPDVGIDSKCLALQDKQAAQLEMCRFPEVDQSLPCSS
jgi:hypothetical protein